MKRKVFFTKAFSFVLVSILLFCSLLLFSCKDKNREYDEEEVLAAARDLISRSILLNEIYYGYGIPVENDLSEANGNYYPADSFYTAVHNFSTLDDLKAMTEAVFTQSYCNAIYSTVFSSVSDAGGIRALSRYYQKYEDAAQTIPVCIMVNTAADVFLVDEVEYDFDTIAVEGAKGEYLYVTMTARAKNADGDVQESVLRVALLEEANGWRIDSPTYRRYNSQLDHYNDLKNK